MSRFTSSLCFLSLAFGLCLAVLEIKRADAEETSAVSEELKNWFQNSCHEMKRDFAKEWPQSEECNCDKSTFVTVEEKVMERDLMKCVKEAKIANCTRVCQSTKFIVGDGCSQFRNDLMDQCEQFCSLVNSGCVINHYGTRCFTYDLHFENEIQGIRQKCADQLKPQLQASYKTNCMAVMKQIDEKVPATLICPGGESKSDNGCEAFCETKVQSYLKEQDYSPEKYMRPFIDSDGRCFSLLIQMRQGQDANVVKACLEEEKEKLKASIVDEEGDFLASAKKEGFEYLLCEKREKDKMACELKLAKKLEDSIKTCEELRNEASDCCHEPQTCIAGQFEQVIQTAGQIHLITASSGGMADQCNALKDVFVGFAVMNAAVASECRLRSSNCVNTCRTQISEVDELIKEACNIDDPSSGDHNSALQSCTENFFKYYVKNLYRKKLAGIPKKCEITSKESNRSIAQMNSRLIGSLGVQAAGCEDGSREGDPPPLGPPFTFPDSPSFIPSIPPLAGSGGNEETIFPDDGLGGNPLNPLDLDFDDEGEWEEPLPPGVKGRPGGLLNASRGGSGGLGGLPSGGGNGGRSRKKSRERKSKQVLLGFRGGKFSGYPGATNETKENRGARGSKGTPSRKLGSLDLKKLLPKDRKLNLTGKFGSPHDDIFKRVSDRFQYMCRTNRTLPCYD